MYIIFIYITYYIFYSNKCTICIQDQNDKNAERNVMVAMRLLRILEKLTSSYGASFTNEMMLDLIELLAQLHG